MLTDPISDMLTRIRNASLAHHDKTSMPASNLKIRIAELLKSEGYIVDYAVEGEVQRTLTVDLKYGRDRRSAIIGIRRSSKPGRRVYVACDAIPKVNNGVGVAILSTSSGVITDRTARDRKVGGELLCEVW